MCMKTQTIGRLEHKTDSQKLCVWMSRSDAKGCLACDMRRPGAAVEQSADDRNILPTMLFATASCAVEKLASS